MCPQLRIGKHSHLYGIARVHDHGPRGQTLTLARLAVLPAFMPTGRNSSYGVYSPRQVSMATAQHDPASQSTLLVAQPVGRDDRQRMRVKGSVTP